MPQINVALAPIGLVEEEARASAARASAVSLDRRRAVGGPKTQIRELRSRHQAILRLDLAGLTQREIAPIVGLTPQMVCVVQNSNIYRAERTRLQGTLTTEAMTALQQASKKLESLCGSSVDVIEEVLLDRGTAPRIRADVAFNILDRNGLRPPERHEHHHTYDTVLLDAYRRRKEAAIAVQATETTALAEASPLALPGRGPGDDEPDDDDDEDDEENED